MSVSAAIKYINTILSNIDHEILLGETAVIVLSILCISYGVSLAVVKVMTMETENVHEPIISVLQSITIGVIFILLERHVDRFFFIPAQYYNVAKVIFPPQHASTRLYLKIKLGYNDICSNCRSILSTISYLLSCYGWKKFPSTRLNRESLYCNRL